MSGRVEPNRHGIYSDDAAECLTLPRKRKGWQGMPIAEIRLLAIDGGWLESAAYDTQAGDCRGGGYGLAKKWGFFPTRSAALDKAMAYLRKGAAGSDSPDCRAIIAWLDTLIPDQLPLFGEAA